MNLIKHINFVSPLRFSLLLASGVFICGLANATPQTNNKEEFVEPKDIEVVEVKGKVNKNSGFFLRKIQRTELDFYRRFNALADNKKFKVRCRKESFVNSRIKKTVCYPQYALDRMHKETQQALRQNMPTPTMKDIEDLTVSDRNESFAYMETVIKKDPELTKLLINMRKAQLEYEEWKSQ
ncbi:hypothetical protein [Alteromonas portus]|uniref:hypothetical protein n=1 Tax=Alteromonas portus TaxID=2565549 RepID=UPI003BF8D4FF